MTDITGWLSRTFKHTRDDVYEAVVKEYTRHTTVANAFSKRMEAITEENDPLGQLLRNMHHVHHSDDDDKKLGD